LTDFLDNPKRYLFFTGKGGVGKTALSCASAIRLADSGKRVLLVSTDPASNLDEMLGVKLCTRPTPVPGVDRLFALNIDPEEAADEYRKRVVAPYLGVWTDAQVGELREQLAGACTVEIAAFDAFAELLTSEDDTSKFDHIVFDTAPTGHTLRLLSLPRAWTSFLESSGTTVTLAETTPVAEAARLQDDLRRARIEPFGWIINSSLALTGSTDPCLRQRIAAELEQIALVRERHARKVAIVPWVSEEPVGPARLLALAHGGAGSFMVPRHSSDEVPVRE
jgi:anion-transporting  ArsA/GET3 family ATPase